MLRFAPAAALVWMCACGYTFVTAGAIPTDVKTVRVEVAPTEDGDPLLADALARQLRELLRWRGLLTPVEPGERSDATLSVRVNIDRTRPVAFDKYDDVLDYLMTVAVDAQLSRTAGGAVLWKENRIAASRGHAAVSGAVVTSSSAFQGEETLDAGALSRFDDVQLGEERRATARDRASRDLAEAIYSSMTEGL